MPVGLTTCPGRLASCLRSHGVKRLSWTTQARVQGPSCSPSSPLRPGPESEAPQLHQLSRVTWVWVRGIAVYTCCLGRLRPGSEVTRVQPALLGDSCPVPSARSINQQSQASRAQFRRSAGSTSCAWRLGPVNEGPWCRPDFQGDSGPAQRARSVDQFSRATRAWV